MFIDSPKGLKMCLAWLFIWAIHALSQSYGASPAMWDHTVLPATGRRNLPHINPSNPEV